ncbi:ribonuclease HII [Planomicrobium sp. CPCC 101110]|uniref:ribonuclease HII n=1 Tax=Planomicrobium sp. CPCC 101110 TaxID=2599619 RepID=UPI0011B3D91D|nr:ribonuclease HII [Planomicrobium sp. CPCC 101110]TWT28172.1 ribonuclease HII [Planomicrobium sp. CPCC 101110]
MKTVTEIRAALKEASEWTPWMEELKQDDRKSVQTLLKQWEKKKRLAEKLIHNHKLKIEFDQSFKECPGSLVAGIDEAGRGPLAGPVVTAAVILPEDCSLLLGLDDSKKMSKDKREAFASLIRKLAVSYSVHVQPPEEIDRQNIYQATKGSMTKAALALNPQPSVVLADAMKLDVPMPCESIIKGDAKSLAIAAASVLAKTGRDAIMDAYAEEYPVYGFAKHAGYGTSEHVAALELYGPCPIHRKTFEPVKSLLHNNGQPI